MAQRFQLAPLGAVLCLSLLGGCAALSPDGGRDAVSAMTRARTGQALPKPATDGGAAAAAEIQVLLGQPLNADSAVQIALLNNQGLQASLAQLGIAEADLVQAGRLRNPGLSFGRLSGGGQSEIERGITFDLGGLLTLPLRRGIEQRRFEQAQLTAASQAVSLAAATRRAYFHAVAARQGAAFMARASAAARAGAELAARMARAGNWSALDLAREQVFHAEAAASFARAQQQETAARERLTRLLGLWGEQTAFTLPQRLPDLPAALEDSAGLEARAMRERLDLQASQRAAEATASALGLTEASAFVNVLELGYANKSSSGQARENGYEVRLELPIFDWGQARNAQARARYMQAVHRTADNAVRARSEVREAYAAYRGNYELARHYRDQVVPLRKKISDQVLLRYNGMLASVFELLADAREQIASVNAAIDSERDFWIAETDLQAALHGGGAPNNE